jgi:hypothetical protein
MELENIARERFFSILILLKNALPVLATRRWFPEL